MKRLVLLLCGVFAGVEHLAAMTDIHEPEVKGPISVAWDMADIVGADDPVMMDVDADNDHELVMQILAIAQSMATRATATALQQQNNPLALVNANTRVRRMFLMSMKSADQHNHNMRSFNRLLARISNDHTKRSIAGLAKQLRQSFCGHEQYNSVLGAAEAVHGFYANMITGIMGLL